VQDSLIIVLSVLAAWIVALTVVFVVARRRLRRTNRVARSVPSPAPLWWLWSPGAAARVHRRLQSATWPVDPDGGEWSLPTAPMTDGLRADLVATALALDDRLVEVRHAPRRTRGREVRRVARSVRVLEQLTHRLAHPAPGHAGPGSGGGGSPRPEQVGAHSTTPPTDPAVELPSWPHHRAEELAALAERVAQIEAGRGEVARLEQAG
jgi:hypothetical protein